MHYTKTTAEQLKLLYPYLLKYYTIKQTYSRDITILTVLLWFSIVHYSSLFQYFVIDLLFFIYSN